MTEKKSKVGNKKKKKESELYSAAYELFTTKGINKTVIDDIVKKQVLQRVHFTFILKTNMIYFIN